MDKQANPVVAAKLIAAMLGSGLMMADSAHVQELQEEAAVLNEMSRMYEARKMQQTIDSLSTQKFASAEWHALRAVKVAAAVTAAGGDFDKLAALLEAEGMDKEALGALIGGLARLGGAALKGLGGGAKALGAAKLPSLGGSGVGAFQKAWQGAAPAAQATQGYLQRAGGWLQGHGASLAAKGQASVAAAAPAAAASKPLLGMGTKAKLVGAGALAGAGYLGYKGLQAGRDYMLAPPRHSIYGTPVANNINQYGVPQY
jgi:hypothetical protein